MCNQKPTSLPFIAHANIKQLGILAIVMVYPFKATAILFHWLLVIGVKLI